MKYFLLLIAIFVLNACSSYSYDWRYIPQTKPQVSYRGIIIDGSYHGNYYRHSESNWIPDTVGERWHSWNQPTIDNFYREQYYNYNPYYHLQY